jgi:hypothetical protein
MKRAGTVTSESTKRLILGVQRLSLRAAGSSSGGLSRKRTPSPVFFTRTHSSMDVVNPPEQARSKHHPESDHASTDESENEDVAPERRSQLTSARRSVKRHESDMDVSMRDRTWSVPRIEQLRGEAKTILSDAMTTVYPQRNTLKSRRLSRASSDPMMTNGPRTSRLAKDLLEEDVGYAGDCECEPDADGLCHMCGRVTTSRCSL